MDNYLLININNKYYNISKKGVLLVQEPFVKETEFFIDIGIKNYIIQKFPILNKDIIVYIQDIRYGGDCDAVKSLVRKLPKYFYELKQKDIESIISFIINKV